MSGIVDLIDEVIQNHEDNGVLEAVRTKVYSLMSGRGLFYY
jgi:glycine/serine hydroxymethyltransferase